MKIKSIFATCFYFFFLFFVYAETKSNVKPLEVDISWFQPWGNCTYDSKSHLYVTNEPCACAGFLLEGYENLVAEYNCLRIKYTTQDFGFFFVLDYNNGEGGVISEEYYCPSNKNEFLIPLNKKWVSRIRDFQLKGIWNHNVHIKIESITLLNQDDTGPSSTWTAGEKVVDNGKEKKIDDSLDAWDYVPKMGVGFQYSVLAGFTYGQDFGIDAGYAWGYPIETKETIHAIAEKGFKTLRLQVSGNFHVIDKNFTIDPAYINQLKKIVDWAIDEGMYVVICEGCCTYYYPESVDKEKNKWVEEKLFGAGYCINKKFQERSEKYLKAFWSQIATAFNNSYDEHLIFEFMNEPIDLTDHGWGPVADCKVCKDDVKVLNKLNQLVLNTIRATGGNNAKRFLMVPTLGQDSFAVDLPGFKLPKDTAKNKLIVSIHNYPMGNYPGNGQDNEGDIKQVWTKKAQEDVILEPFKKADKAFFNKHIPIAVTEFGCSCWTPLVERMECAKDFMTEVTKSGRSCVITMHEDSNHNIYDNFGYLNKTTNTWYENEFVDLLIKMAANENISSEEKFIKDNKIKYDSLVGKNLLENAPVDMGYWTTYLRFNGDKFAKKIPEKFTLEIKYRIPSKLPSNTPWCDIQVKYPDRNWNTISYTNSSNVSGGTYHDDGKGNFSISLTNKPSSSGTILIKFDKEMSKTMECYGIVFQAGNVILDSVIIRE